MRLKQREIFLLVAGLIGIVVLVVLGLLRFTLNGDRNQDKLGSYSTLEVDTSTENPLAYIRKDFSVEEDFNTNLPIVILTMEGEVPEYKSFSEGNEIVNEEVEPYVTGSMRVIDSEDGNNRLLDTTEYSTTIELKKRGHTSFNYDKSQYLIKTLQEDGSERTEDILGMGAGDSWVLNGSMADKSMIRNYLGYRLAAEIGGSGLGPDSRFCEVIIEQDGKYEYQGLYLLTEDISRGESRVDIDKYDTDNIYSSYIVRRDRFTNFDPMLETFGRLQGFSDQWIGVKYPSESKLTQNTKEYIEKDFSRIESIIYSEDDDVFSIYDKYIDIDSFVDYFLINEYLGNYDAGEHSTYMYKNSGDLLHIGPVWDFDQAMNNYYQEEMNTETLAFQTKPFFDRLIRDSRFIDCLKDRYSVLISGVLSEDNVYAIIDEATAYISSARQREWYRWAADYEEGDFTNPHNYYLQDYELDGITVSRFNTNYEQEIYNIKTYIHKHSLTIQPSLTELYDSTIYNSSLGDEKGLFLFAILALFIVPSVLINRKK